MRCDYNKIFLAHYKTKLPLMIWGSSGYGKTSSVVDFANKNGFELVVLHAQYLDPLALFVPSTAEMKDLGYVKVYPSEILHRIFNSKTKMILFLDELTRARDETFNILTELLLDRTVFGYRVPPHVLIIGASNFAEEDSGVREMPDAVMQRLTHLIHAPDSTVTSRFLTSKVAREVVGRDPKMIHEPGRFPIHDFLKACPRQIDACGRLAEAGLRGDELIEVCRGRIGIETGTELAMRFEMHLSGTAKLLPDIIRPEEFPRIAKAETEGGVLEVVRFLCQQMTAPSNHPHIATYILEHASPEVCRSLQIHGFSYVFQHAPRRKNGDYFQTHKKPGTDSTSLETPGKAWQWYAVKIGKMTPR
jgi:hypothetical protein